MFTSHIRNSKPLFYVGNLPVYVVTLFVAISAFATLLIAIGGQGSIRAVETFGVVPSYEGLPSWLWSPLTYAFVNPPVANLGAGFWVAIGLIINYLLGRVVEDYFGGRAFTKILLIAIIAPALVVYGTHLLMVLAGTDGLVRFGFFGSTAISMAIFIAFAILMPDARMIFGISAKWLAIVALGMISMANLFVRDWASLWMMWGSIVAIYSAMLWQGGPNRFPKVDRFIHALSPKRIFGQAKQKRAYDRSKRNLSVMKKPSGKRGAKRKVEPKIKPRPDLPKSDPSVDVILDKISREGIKSLSPEEKKILEAARSSLMDKDTDSGLLKKDTD